MSPRTAPATQSVLDIDVLLCIVEFADNDALLRLCRTSRLLRRLATPALYAHVELGSYSAFYNLARSLDARPTLGLHVRSLSESRPFLYDETGPPDGARTLAGTIASMPHLRRLRLVSHVEVDPERFADMLHHLSLRALLVAHLSPDMAGALARIPPVAQILLRGPRSVTKAIAAYVLRCRETLEIVHVDAEVLRVAFSLEPAAVWPRLRRLQLHGDVPQVALPLARAFPSLATLGSEPWSSALLAMEAPENGASKDVHVLSALTAETVGWWTRVCSGGLRSAVSRLQRGVHIDT